MNLDIKRIGNNYKIFFTGYQLIFSGITVKGKDISSVIATVLPSDAFAGKTTLKQPEKQHAERLEKDAPDVHYYFQCF